MTILDGGSRYLINGVPVRNCPRKSDIEGRVFAFLLDNLGARVSVDKIAEFGWKFPVLSMDKLCAKINSSDSYQLTRVGDYYVLDVKENAYK